jgi:hypothetical protein
MLLNISNHPSSSWPQLQMDMAIREYGRVADMPFPHIDPEAGETEIEELADQYLSRILEIKPEAVHLMGELNFTFALSKRILSHGVTCLASTTHRRTEDLPDGTKVSKFEFVRFRKYLP